MARGSFSAVDQQPILAESSRQPYYSGLGRSTPATKTTMRRFSRLAPLLLGLTTITGCAAATSGAAGGAADSLSALRPQYVSTYVRHQSKPVVIRNATILTAAGPEISRGSI